MPLMRKYSYLPEDLLLLIQVRLPIKSLLFFKSVSKSWNLLISSPEFIKLHLHRSSSIHKIPNKLSYTEDVYDTPKGLHSCHIHMAEFSFTTATTTGINVELDCEFQRLYHPYESLGLDMESKIVGSCNGLLCQILIPKIWKGVIYGECDISLCNPSTRSSWVLPKRSLVRTQVCYGFGYDDVHDDYKVMITCWAPGHLKYECEVYSLTSNTWSIVRSDLDFTNLVRNKDGVLVDCALHWIMKDTRPAHSYVIAFDLRTDEHKILPLPEELERFKLGLELSVLNGCLLVYKDTIDFSFGRPDATCNFWVMKDYGIKDSWTRIRIRNTTCDLGSLVPVALLEDNNERKLVYFMYDNLGPMIFLYDIVSLEVLMFPVYNCWHINERLEFVGSLVQPHPPNIGTGKSTFGESPQKKMKKV